jgi:hypothetical protein
MQYPRRIRRRRSRLEAGAGLATLNVRKNLAEQRRILDAGNDP